MEVGLVYSMHSRSAGAPQRADLKAKQNKEETPKALIPKEDDMARKTCLEAARPISWVLNREERREPTSTSASALGSRGHAAPPGKQYSQITPSVRPHFTSTLSGTRSQRQEKVRSPRTG